MGQLSLDADVTRLSLRFKSIEREIPLDDVVQVCNPDESVMHPSVTNTAHLDERCTTLVLNSTHFLTLSFDNQRQREFFETCLQALLVARHQKSADPNENAKTFNN